MSGEHSAMQKFFDKATSGVIAQGRPSIIGSSCLYRWKNGETVMACAIGQCLTDEQIAKYRILEGETPAGGGPLNPPFPRALIEELLPGVDYDHAIKFLSDLQGCHDSLSETDKDFVVKFAAACNGLAVKYGLNPVDEHAAIAKRPFDT